MRISSMEVLLKSHPFAKCENAENDSLAGANDSYPDVKTENTDELHAYEIVATNSGFSEVYVESEMSHKDIILKLEPIAKGGGDSLTGANDSHSDLKTENTNDLRTYDSVATYSGFTEADVKSEIPHQGLGIQDDGDIELKLLHEEIDIKDEFINFTTKDGFTQQKHIKFPTEIEQSPKYQNSIVNYSEVSTSRMHMRNYTTKKPFDCAICNKIFRSSGNLKSHMIVHTGEKPFDCKTCYKKFARTSDLNKHMRIHTGETPFYCQVCKKGFIESSKLKVHMRAHTGEEPFDCNLCNRKFRESKSLKRHIRVHTGETPFVCKVCKKGFTESTNFKNHVRKHTGEKPFDCKLCKKKFEESRKLKRHIMSHTGEKPFHCKICSKGFTRSSNLNNHIRIHTGEKPFDCKMCSKLFTHSSSFRKHMKIHTQK